MLHGRQRGWLAYLHDVVGLIDAGAATTIPDLARARARATAVMANHHNLLLALPGRGAERTAADRARLAGAAEDLTHEHEGADEHDDIPHDRGLELTADQLELQQRAREFVEHVLMPLELEAEERGGALPEETVDDDQARGDRGAAQRRPVRAASTADRAGRCSSGSWSTSSSAASPTACTGTSPAPTTCWSQGTPEQIERYLLPALRGEGGDAYAVTEAEAGSDPAGSPPLRWRTDGGWRINGEKWFVTSGDVARVLIVMANVVDGADRLPTLFLVEPGAPGVEFVDDPRFTHNYPHGHPTIRFTDVEVGRRRGDRRRRRGRGAPARAGSPRSGSGSPPTASARCGACSTRRPAGR